MALHIRYPATNACNAARVDKQRFNEAVAAGRYRCAPEVRKGGTRSFLIEDVLALFVYGRLIEQEIPSRIAGDVACRVREELARDPEAKEVRISRFSETGTENQGNNDGEPQSYSVHIEWVFNLAGMRQEVTKTLKESIKS